MLFAQTKDAKIVCVIGCQITRTRIHTLLKRLASVRHDNREKTVLFPDCTLQTKQLVKTKKVDDVFSRHPLYCGRAGSDVIGCHRPIGGVFIYVCFRHEFWTAFPIATPRLCSSKFPWRGTQMSTQRAVNINLSECKSWERNRKCWIYCLLKWSRLIY